jgi:hypothetical protein
VPHGVTPRSGIENERRELLLSIEFRDVVRISQS